MGSLRFVELKEEIADAERSREFVSYLASKSSAAADEDLLSRIDERETYLTPELRAIYHDWYQQKLCSCAYPQYASFRAVRENEVKQGARGDAYMELMKLVGLEGVKEVVNQFVDFRKMKKYLAERDIRRESPAAHMVFKGNPGTAKTTVARLLARIMRDNGLLSSGHLVEVGRADLVGCFVGHTAPLVKKCFKQARGGVLFIDEAYSLLDDKEGLFGDEAINTIVQEMENMRDELVVIFAGYPDKMDQFIQRNPGLRSRIAHHVHFPDYSVEELCEIALLDAEKRGLTVTDRAREKLATVFEKACKADDFGNGRFARTVIEKATMAQASRLVKEDIENLGKQDLNRILAEDVPAPNPVGERRTQIGFCA